MDPSRAREIALAFLKFGVTAYGGLAAIWGVIQADLQEKRGWLSKERFLEGLALINMLPGAVAVQLCIFVGHSRAGWWGGLLAGLCFVLPAFLIMMVLTLGYAAYGATPVISGALYGLGPVVVAIFLAATWRLARTAAATPMQLVILIAAAVAAAWSPLGTASIFLIAGALGVALFHSRARGLLALGLVHARPQSTRPAEASSTSARSSSPSARSRSAAGCR
jgi:chromate transporter